MTTARRAATYAIVTVIVSVLTLAVAGWVYTNAAIDNAIHTADMRWCGQLTAFDRIYAENYPRLSPAGRDLAWDTAKRLRSYGCGEPRYTLDMHTAPFPTPSPSPTRR